MKKAKSKKAKPKKIRRPAKKARKNKKRQKSPNFLLFFILVFSASVIFGAIGRTSAYFSDMQNSPNNGYSAGTLDFEVYSEEENFIPLHKAENMQEGSSVRRNIFIKKKDDISFKYKISAEPIGGECDAELYGALILKAYYNYIPQFSENAFYNGNQITESRYDGLLKDFKNIVINEGIDNSGNFLEWMHFSIEMPIGFEAARSCKFNFIFEAWQSNLDDGAGFSAKKIISSFIQAKEIQQGKKDDDAGEDIPDAV